MIYIAAYVATWIMLLNALWLLYLAAHSPQRLAALLDERQSFTRDDTYPVWRARAHVILALLGTFCASLFLCRTALGFIPYDWGRVDADGDFQATRDGIAGLLALLITYLVSRLVADGVSLRETIDDLRKNGSDLKVELEKSNGRLNDVAQQYRVLEADIEAIRTNHLHEARLLKEEILRLRSLVPPDVLAEEERRASAQAKAPRKTYRL